MFLFHVQISEMKAALKAAQQEAKRARDEAQTAAAGRNELSRQQGEFKASIAKVCRLMALQKQ